MTDVIRHHMITTEVDYQKKNITGIEVCALLGTGLTSFTSRLLIILRLTSLLPVVMIKNSSKSGEKLQYERGSWRCSWITVSLFLSYGIIKKLNILICASYSIPSSLSMLNSKLKFYFIICHIIQKISSNPENGI